MLRFWCASALFVALSFCGSPQSSSSQVKEVPVIAKEKPQAPRRAAHAFIFDTRLLPRVDRNVQNPTSGRNYEGPRDFVYRGVRATIPQVLEAIQQELQSHKISERSVEILEIVLHPQGSAVVLKADVRTLEVLRNATFVAQDVPASALNGTEYRTPPSKPRRDFESLELYVRHLDSRILGVDHVDSKNRILFLRALDPSVAQLLPRILFGYELRILLPHEPIAPLRGGLKDAKQFWRRLSFSTLSSYFTGNPELLVPQLRAKKYRRQHRVADISATLPVEALFPTSVPKFRGLSRLRITADALGVRHRYQLRLKAGR